MGIRQTAYYRLSNEKRVDIGDYTTQLCWDYNKPLYGFDTNFDTPKKGDLWNSLFSSGFSSLPFALNKISKGHYDFGKSDHPIDLQKKVSEMAINIQWLVDRMRIKSTFTNRVTSSCAHSTYIYPQ